MRLLWTMTLMALAACAPGSKEDETGGAVDTANAVDEVCGATADIGLEVGQCAPDFALPDRYGEVFTLSSMRGKVALVDISAVW